MTAVAGEIRGIGRLAVVRREDPRDPPVRLERRQRPSYLVPEGAIGGIQGGAAEYQVEGDGLPGQLTGHQVGGAS